MTNAGNGSSDRLDRIEQLVESNAQVIQALAGQMSEVSESLRNLIRTVELNGRYQNSSSFLMGGALEDHEERIRILEAELGITPRLPEANDD